MSDIVKMNKVIAVPGTRTSFAVRGRRHLCKGRADEAGVTAPTNLQLAKPGTSPKAKMASTQNSTGHRLDSGTSPGKRLYKDVRNRDERDKRSLERYFHHDELIGVRIFMTKV